MRRLRPALPALALLAIVGLGLPPTGRPAGAQAATAGAWATYEWRSAVKVEVPVLVQQPGAAGAPATWSVDRETTTPRPLYVTYGIVRSDAKSYVLQILTRLGPDATPLSITQVTVDRTSGKALKSVIRDKKGVIATPESGLRPFREAAVKGTREEVAVPAGRFTAVKASYRNGTVWVSDKVPALGLVKATLPDGELELVRSGTAGAQDLLRS
jgi:hypothetical protein